MLKKKNFSQIIQNLDKDEERGVLSEEKSLARSKAKEELQETVFQEQINWRQKSRMNWLRYGNSKTKFLHSFANNHRSRNHISSLIINGNFCEDQKIIEDGIDSFYKQFTFQKSVADCLVFQLVRSKTLRRSVVGWKDLSHRRRSSPRCFLWSFICG